MVDNPKTLVQRVQLSGLCYMHAPTVVLHYAIWNTKLKSDPAAESDHGMLDMAAEIALHFSRERLGAHIFHGAGNYSADFLKGILHSGSEVLARYPREPVQELMECLREYGPAVVSNFGVHEDFLDKAVRHHHGLPDTTKFHGKHAMVLVGIRVNDSGKVFYLLQNWWKGKQFVEVSREYMVALRASFHFVVTPQKSVSTDRHRFHSGRMRYAETEATIDLPERLPVEWVL
jgi:hypothetical protein